MAYSCSFVYHRGAAASFENVVDDNPPESIISGHKAFGRDNTKAVFAMISERLLESPFREFVEAHAMISAE